MLRETHTLKATPAKLHARCQNQYKCKIMVLTVNAIENSNFQCLRKIRRKNWNAQQPPQPAANLKQLAHNACLVYRNAAARQRIDNKTHNYWIAYRRRNISRRQAGFELKHVRSVPKAQQQRKQRQQCVGHIAEDCTYPHNLNAGSCSVTCKMTSIGNTNEEHKRANGTLTTALIASDASSTATRTHLTTIVTTTTKSNNTISYNNKIRLYARKRRLRKRRKRKSITIKHYLALVRRCRRYTHNMTATDSSTACATNKSTSSHSSGKHLLTFIKPLKQSNQLLLQLHKNESYQLQQQPHLYTQSQQQHYQEQQYQYAPQPKQRLPHLLHIRFTQQHLTANTIAPATTISSTQLTRSSFYLLVAPLITLAISSVPKAIASLMHCLLHAILTIISTTTTTIYTLPISSYITKKLQQYTQANKQQHKQHQQQQQQQQHFSCSCSSDWNLNELFKNLWIFLLIYLNLTAKVCLAGYHEKRLLHDLLDPYNTLERPVLNESDPLQLSFGLTLMQIIDVDEKNQLLVTNVWLKLEWNDMNLRWNTSDYGGIKDLRIPPHRIWKPDVLMYNSADEGFDGTYQTNVVVRNNGSCLYVPPGIFKSTCKIDITWFPFDDQRCEMKFGSWTYDGFQLDLQLQDETGGDISSYVLNGEWELLGVPGKRNEIYYNCCPEPYIDITFAIIIRRRTLYYFFNLIIPCVLIASMALLGFTLPPDSGEKLSLGVTILLSLTVFLNMVAETMPATSDAVPLLGTYFNCIMFMVASSVVSTILILNYHHRNADTHEMSEWIRIVFLCWLPWILRMSRPGRPLILEFPTTPCSDTSSERKHQILSDVELKERSSKSLLANVLDIDDDFRHSCRPMTPGGTLPHNPAFYRTVYGQGDDGSIGPIGSTRMPDAVTHHTCLKSSTEYELSLILKEIRFITDQLRKEDEENDIANDWKFAAMVVDRLCLIIFTMFTILATIAVLLSAPHIIVS